MNLFVANIDRVVNDDALKLLFEAIGEVSSAKVIRDRDTGESKGFGFVDMRDDREAFLAIEKLTNAAFFGRKLVVSKARPKSESY